jgi:hypothetical protein
MKDAGVGCVRFDFYWQDIEPVQGEFHFRRLDLIVDELARNNIHILGLLHYSADWASACGKWNCPPKDNKVFVNYALRVVERYKGKVKYWEVWNEPDSGTYWKPQDGLKSYCILLKDVYQAVKKADPDCLVLNGGISSGISGINLLYDNGAKGYFDILNVHIFENPLRPGAIKSVDAYVRTARKIMARNGDGRKKLWVTEIGCPGVKTGSRTAKWWAGENPDERRQAAWVREVYGSLMESGGVEKIFWAFLRDTKGHWGNGVDHFGLLRWDFSRKPAFAEYRDLSRKWRAARNKSR